MCTETSSYTEIPPVPQTAACEVCLCVIQTCTVVTLTAVCRLWNWVNLQTCPDRHWSSFFMWLLHLLFLLLTYYKSLILSCTLDVKYLNDLSALSFHCSLPCSPWTYKMLLLSTHFVTNAQWNGRLQHLCQRSRTTYMTPPTPNVVH